MAQDNELTKTELDFLRGLFDETMERAAKGADILSVLCVGTFSKYGGLEPVQFGISDKNISWFRGNLEVKSFSAKGKKTYTRHIPVCAFGDLANSLVTAREGDRAIVFGRLNREEYQGRWYETIVAYRALLVGKGIEGQGDEEASPSDEVPF